MLDDGPLLEGDALSEQPAAGEEQYFAAAYEIDSQREDRALLNEDNPDALENVLSSSPGGMRDNAGGVPLRRAMMVKSFMKQGEDNEVFADKAPSILSSDRDNFKLGADSSKPRAGLMGGASQRLRTPKMQSTTTAHGSPMIRGRHGKDFTTVDWARDQERHWSWRRYKWKNSGWFSHVDQAWRAGQGWIAVLLIGLFTGCFAGFIDLCVHWLIDIRLGYCVDGFWLNAVLCCNAFSPIDVNCPAWQTWSEVFGYTSDHTSAFGLSLFWIDYAVFIGLGLLFAGTSAWLCMTFSPYASGSGIPEIKTILSGMEIKRYLGGTTLITKIFGLCLSVGSGLSLGKEGPYVHIATCTANILSRFFPKYAHNRAKRNELLSAGASAGVAVAFGAPVGGVLFSLEEISSYFPHKTMWRAFFCAITAALTLQFLDPNKSGKLIMFQITYDLPWRWFEMIPFVFIGAMGGVFGSLFIELNLWVSDFRKKSKLKQHPILEALWMVLLTSMVKFLSNFMRGSGTDVLAGLFDSCDSGRVDPLDMCDLDHIGQTIFNLLLCAIVTFCLTIFTFGMPVPAGVFIPSMTVGACLGRMVGTMVKYIQVHNQDHPLFHDCSISSTACVTPGIYALVGAAAMLGGVTRMTVSLVVIMFELTGTAEYLSPILVAIMVSKWVGDWFGDKGLYERYIGLHQYPFLDAKEEFDYTAKAADIMSTDLIVLSMHGHTIDNLLLQIELLSSLDHTGFPVVTSTRDMLVVGYITRQDLKRGIQRNLRRPGISGSTKCYFGMLDLRFPKNAPFVDLRPWLHPTPVQVVETAPLHGIHNMFGKLGIRYCLVAGFGKLMGIITKKDVLQFLSDKEHEHSLKGKGDKGRDDDDEKKDGKDVENQKPKEAGAHHNARHSGSRHHDVEDGPAHEDNIDSPHGRKGSHEEYE